MTSRRAVHGHRETEKGPDDGSTLKEGQHES
jgi:hypothetical protein